MEEATKLTRLTLSEIDFNVCLFSFRFGQDNIACRSEWVALLDAGLSTWQMKQT